MPGYILKCIILLRDGSNRMLSSSADATYFINCSGKISMDICKFDRVLDNATNIYGTLKELKPILQGWLQYLRLARMKNRLDKIERWLRFRLKRYRLKQCKRVIGIVCFLISLGVDKTLSWRTTLNGKWWWRFSNSSALNIGINNRWFAVQGLYSLGDNYKRLFLTSF